MSDTWNKKPNFTRVLWVTLLIVVGAVLFILVLTNRHTTHVGLIFWTIETRVFILIPTVFLLGFLGGYGLKTLLGAGGRSRGGISTGT